MKTIDDTSVMRSKQRREDRQVKTKEALDAVLRQTKEFGKPVNVDFTRYGPRCTERERERSRYNLSKRAEYSLTFDPSTEIVAGVVKRVLAGYSEYAIPETWAHETSTTNVNLGFSNLGTLGIRPEPLAEILRYSIKYEKLREALKRKIGDQLPEQDTIVLETPQLDCRSEKGLGAVYYAQSFSFLPKEHFMKCFGEGFFREYKPVGPPLVKRIFQPTTTTIFSLGEAPSVEDRERNSQWNYYHEFPKTVDGVVDVIARHFKTEFAFGRENGLDSEYSRKEFNSEEKHLDLALKCAQ